MASNLAQQLQRIADKDALHKWIDALPDQARFVVLCDPGEDEHFVYRRLGEFLRSEVIYMMACLQFKMLADEDP